MLKKREETVRWYAFWLCFLVVSCVVGYSCGGGAADVASGGRTSLPSNRSVQTATTTSTASQAVEEADLYRKQGNLLFYLHAYKGLTIFSMADPQKPKILSNLPVFGYPVEMFVTDKTAFVMVNRPFSMMRKSSALTLYLKDSLAQLISIDISNPQKPKLLQRLDLSAPLIPGYSRKIGDAIYVLSQVYATRDSFTSRVRRLQVFQVKEPSAMRHVHQLEVTTTEQLPVLASGANVFVKRVKDVGQFGGELVDDPDLRSDRLLFHFLQPNRALNTVMTATSTRLIIAENWLFDVGMAILPPSERETQPEPAPPRSFGGFAAACSQGTSRAPAADVTSFPSLLNTQLNYTIVHIFDLTGSAVQLQTRFMVQGHMSDQFKQTIVKSGKDDLYLGIIRRNGLQIAAERITSEVQNLLLSIHLSQGQARLRNMLAFGKPGETVRASLYDPKRQVVYAITATGTDRQDQAADRVNVDRTRTEDLRMRDPLYALSYQDPDKLQALSSIDELSGDINLFRLIDDGKFLLAVGRDNSASCTGFAKDTGLFSRTAVSLVDVRDLSAIRLVQRRCVSVHPEVKVVSSDVNWDRDQAHKYIGLHESSQLNVVAVPVRFQDNKTNTEHTAIGMMRWDLKRYNPKLSNTQQTVLSDLGTLTHQLVHGALLRTLFFASTSDSTRPVLVNLAEHSLTVATLADLAKPKFVATLEISPEADAVYLFGSYLVTQYKPNIQGLDQKSQAYLDAVGTRLLHVRRLDAQGDDGSLPQLKLEKVRDIVPWKQSLLVFRDDPVGSSQSLLQIIDFQNPAQPKVGADIKLSQIPSLALRASVQGQPGEVGQTWVRTPHGLLFTHTVSSKSKTLLLFLDLTQPSRPAIRQLRELPMIKLDYVLLRVDENNVVLAVGPASRSDSIESSNIQHWTWQKDHWVGDAEVLFPVGQCLMAYHKDGQWLYLSGNGNPTTGYGYSRIGLYRQTKDGTALERLAEKQLTHIYAQKILVHGDMVSVHSPGGGLQIYRVDATDLKLYASSPMEYRYGPEEKRGDLYLENAHGYFLQFRVSETGGILWIKVPSVSDKSGWQSLFFAPNYFWRSQANAAPIRETKRTSHVVLWNNQAYIAAGFFGVVSFDLNSTNIPLQK